jgi:cytochrome P450
MLDGPRHRDVRKLMMPALHGERMHAYERVMRERADAIIDRWPVGKAFALHPEMQEVTLAVILETVFGLGEGATRGALREALVAMLDMGEHPSLLMLIDRNGRARGTGPDGKLGRFSPWQLFARKIERVDALLAGEVRARRAAGAGGNDVLSMLLAARDEEGRGLSDQALVDEMKTLLTAGHETTANALTWTVLELAQNPAILARLRDEMTRGDEYLDAVIRESLRLHPIVPMIGRQLQADATVGGRRYPKGTMIAPNIYLTHTNPDVYPDPMRFDPERFLGAKRPGPYEYLAFGGGTRRCIGMAFAFFEMRVVLRQIVTRARLRLAPGYKPRLVRRGITFAVSDGLPVVRDA